MDLHFTRFFSFIPSVIRLPGGVEEFAHYYALGTVSSVHFKEDAIIVSPIEGVDCTLNGTMEATIIVSPIEGVECALNGTMEATIIVSPIEGVDCALNSTMCPLRPLSSYCSMQYTSLLPVLYDSPNNDLGCDDTTTIHLSEYTSILGYLQRKTTKLLNSLLMPGSQ